ncbi:MAG: gluconate 2-dehydrogenase subunit 3 family protein [Terriglobia bacterium]
MSRRKALAQLLELTAAATSAWLAKPVFGAGSTAPSAVASASSPAAQPATTFFSPDQKATIAALADLIIPADEISPGAKAAGVDTFIDFLIANSPREDQQAWVDGLRALDEACRARYGNDFRSLPADRQEDLLAEIAGEEVSPRTDSGRFFVRVKHAVAEGFYTSKIGLQDDLKYQGNTYVDAPATCADQFGSGQASNEAHQAGAHQAATHCDRASGEN